MSGAFHIVALIYIIIAGQPIVDEPVRIPHKMVFQDLDACIAFMGSEPFSIQKAALSDMVRGSVKIPTAAGEDPPDFGIAITTSCEPDNTL